MPTYKAQAHHCQYCVKLVEPGLGRRCCAFHLDSNFLPTHHAVLTIVDRKRSWRVASIPTARAPTPLVPNLSNSTEDLGVSNQEDIICKVHGMDFRELLDLVVEHPFFLTDNYFIQIKHAVQARYAELTSETRAYYSF